MKTGAIAAIAVLVCSLPAGYIFFNRNRCAPLNDAAKAKLLTYVQKKYKVASSADLQLTDSTPVGSSCYRKLEFKSQNSPQPIHIFLFATPDLKYLSRELLDADADPVIEVTGKQQELPGVAAGALPSLGPADAPVTVAVFSDFQCPYCARFAAMMRKEVMPEEGRRVRFVFRQFPLPMHPWARAAAEASSCAYQQKHEYFWRFHDFFFEHQRELTPANLRRQVLEHAREVPGLDPSKFVKCLAQGGGKALVERDASFAVANGLEDTPTVFLNGKETEIVAAEQLLTLIRELSPSTASAGTYLAAPPVR